MTTPDQDSLLAELAETGRLALWVLGIVSLVMALGTDDGLEKFILRASATIFCFGLLMFLWMRRLLPNLKILNLAILVISLTSGVISVVLKLSDLL